MDFLNGLGRKLNRAARSVQELTRESVENSRLSADLRAAKGELDRLYGEVGRAYFESLSGGDKVPLTLLERVRAAREQVNALTARREPKWPLKLPPRCGACGAVQQEGARFCSSCGKRLPEEAPEPPASEEDNAEYCAVCGAMRCGLSGYCAVCGAAFGGIAESPPAIVRRPDAPEPLEEPENYEE